MQSRSSRVLVTALSAAALVLVAGCSKSPPPTSGSEPIVRLLSEPQYRAIIADVFGQQIVVGGTFDPMVRTNGLLTVGASKAHITPAGLEQFDRMARSIACSRRSRSLSSRSSAPSSAPRRSSSACRWSA